MQITPPTRAAAFACALVLMSGCPSTPTKPEASTKPVGQRSTAGKLDSPSPSLTATPTATPTAQPSKSPSPSPTASVAAGSPSPSPSASASATASPTASPTATPTPQPLKVSTVAGVAAEPAATEGLGATLDGADKGLARLNQPSALAFDKNGALLVADAGNNRIRKLVFDAAGRATVTTLAGSTSGDSDNTDPLLAQFKSPGGLAVDMSNNDVYVADTGNQKIKRISASNGAVHALAGSGAMGNTNGPGAGASFTFPRALVLDNGKLLVCDTESNMVRSVDVAGSNDVSTFIGTGGTVVPTPGLTFPFGLAIDSAKSLYVAQQGSSTVRKIDKDGVVTTLAGTSGSTGYADGNAASAKFDLFNNGAGLAVGSDGTIYLADSGNVVIRAIKADKVTTYAGARVYADEASKIGLPPGDGLAADAKFNAPIALAIAADGTLYVADRDNNCIRRIKK
ncbi:MAG: hypothetical protein JWM80_915 [Cyanobacteria bacterium RYN_339]|nr:hypothetical protein [Cyanobacteria bacterium RYN_339]